MTTDLWTILILDTQVIYVLGKGRRWRTVPFGGRTGQALARYLRIRSQEKFASHSGLCWPTATAGR